MLRRDLRWAFLLLPLPLLSMGMARAADRVGKACGAELARVAMSFMPAPARELSAEIVEPERDNVTEEQTSEAVATLPAKSARSKSNKRAVTNKTEAVPKGIRVSAATILKLAAQGAAPRGVPVAAQGSRPRGLRLVGVSALGIGVRDGDVLTHAAGQPLRSAADVVNVVIAARARMAKEISGQLYRGQQRFSIVVEQPYVAHPSEAAESARAAQESTRSAAETACAVNERLTEAGHCTKSRKL